jgi:competence protein ComEC
LGGMVSALLAAIVPKLGSFSAGLLHYPIAALLGIVDQMGRLPGSQWAAGTISVGVLVILYGFLGIAVGNSKFIQPKRYWILGMTIAALSIIFVPAWQQAQTRIQITALTTTRQPILVVQAQGKVVLVNTGDRNETEMTIIPFLQKQGINQVDALIQLHSTDLEAVQALRTRLSIRQVLTTNDFQELNLGHITLRTIPLPQPGLTLRGKDRADPIVPALQLQLPHQAPWILAHKLPRKLASDTLSSTPAILWWNGGKLPEMQLVGAIAYGKTLRPEVAQTLDQQRIPTFHLAQDGAVQWSPRDGFKTSFSVDDAEFARL